MTLRVTSFGNVKEVRKYLEMEPERNDRILCVETRRISDMNLKEQSADENIGCVDTVRDSADGVEVNNTHLV